MADKVVNIPGVGLTSFPDTMSDEAIGDAIHKHLISTTPPETKPGMGPLPQGLAPIDQRSGAQMLLDKLGIDKNSTAQIGTNIAGSIANHLPEGVGAVGSPEGAAAGLAGMLKRGVGLAGSMGTGYGVNKGAQALGLPPWLAETLGVGAGAAVGSKLAPGATEEIMNLLKKGGVRAAIGKLVSGEKEPPPPVPLVNNTNNASSMGTPPPPVPMNLPPPGQTVGGGSTNPMPPPQPPPPLPGTNGPGLSGPVTPPSGTLPSPLQQLLMKPAQQAPTISAPGLGLNLSTESTGAQRVLKGGKAVEAPKSVPPVEPNQALLDDLARAQTADRNGKGGKAFNDPALSNNDRLIIKKLAENIIEKNKIMRPGTEAPSTPIVSNPNLNKPILSDKDIQAGNEKMRAEEFLQNLFAANAAKK